MKKRSANTSKVIENSRAFDGAPMNFSAHTNAATVEGATQTIAKIPVAVLEFIQNLGTNGGFFNTNSAHADEDPTPLTNFIEMLAIVILPAAFTYTFGKTINRQRRRPVIKRGFADRFRFVRRVFSGNGDRRRRAPLFSGIGARFDSGASII